MEKKSRCPYTRLTKTLGRVFGSKGKEFSVCTFGKKSIEDKTTDFLEEKDLDQKVFKDFFENSKKDSLIISYNPLEEIISHRDMKKFLLIKKRVLRDFIESSDEIEPLVYISQSNLYEKDFPRYSTNPTIVLTKARFFDFPGYDEYLDQVKKDVEDHVIGKLDYIDYYNVGEDAIPFYIIPDMKKSELDIYVKSLQENSKSIIGEY